jgi:hypothetical protein
VSTVAREARAPGPTTTVRFLIEGQVVTPERSREGIRAAGGTAVATAPAPEPVGYRPAPAGDAAVADAAGRREPPRRPGEGRD